MINVVFLEMEGGSVATFDWAFPSGALTDRATRRTFGSPNQVLSSGVYADRVKAYELDSGGRAGDDNAWCNFKCSGCHRPLQASRWYLKKNGGFSRMKDPENSLGKFIGERGTEMDDAGLRPYSPNGVLPAELSDGVCWHENRWRQVKCDGLAAYYNIAPSRFV